MAGWDSAPRRFSGTPPEVAAQSGASGEEEEVGGSGAPGESVPAAGEICRCRTRKRGGFEGGSQSRGEVAHRGLCRGRVWACKTLASCELRAGDEADLRGGAGGL